MKRKFFVLLFVLIIIVSLVFNIKFYLELNNYKTENENKKISEENEKNKNLQEENDKRNKENEMQKFLEENVYDNNIKVGIYTKKNNKFVLTDTLYCDWSMESVFSIFYVIASDEKEIVSSNFKNTFNEYWGKFEKSKSYKIGYNIKYSLDSGEKINKNVLNPEIAESLFSDLQFYMYDDVTDMGNRIYYHMRQYEMTDETLLTSVKICGDKITPAINGPIELTAFTYNGDEDFDKETKEYLGKSKFTTKIYRKRVD